MSSVKDEAKTILAAFFLSCVPPTTTDERYPLPRIYPGTLELAARDIESLVDKYGAA